MFLIDMLIVCDDSEVQTRSVDNSHNKFYREFVVGKFSVEFVVGKFSVEFVVRISYDYIVLHRFTNRFLV